MGEGSKPIVAYLDGTPIGKVQKLSFSEPCNPTEWPLSSLTLTIHEHSPNRKSLLQ